MKTALLLFLGFFYCYKLSSQNSLEILNETIKSCEKIKTLKFVLYKKERIRGKYNEDASFFKLNKSPFKMYMKQIVPIPGLEALYCEGYNDGEVKVNPNSFPFVNLNLDPLGRRLRQNQHHTLFELGYDYFLEIFRHLMNKYKDKISMIAKYEGEVNFNKYECYKINIDFNDFHFYDYTVKQGETISSIAKKFKVCDHMILERNNIDFYTDNVEGKILKIPNVYAKHIVLYISKKLMVPVYIACYDDIGLYEVYEFSNIEINPIFKCDEFSEDFPEYGF